MRVKKIMVKIFLFFISYSILIAQKSSSEAFIRESIEQGYTNRLLLLSLDGISELDAVMLNALLEINASKAVTIYRQISAVYPKSLYAELCKKKIDDFTATRELVGMDYTIDLNGKKFDAPKIESIKEDKITAPLPSKEKIKPMSLKELKKIVKEAAKESKEIISERKFVLQFASFQTQASANIYRKNISPTIPTRIKEMYVVEKKQKFYKVWTVQTFPSYEEAEQFGRKSGIDYFIMEE